ncbi:MAG: hypothetical protein V4598_09810 [Bdellovibrionota bacterium]
MKKIIWGAVLAVLGFLAFIAFRNFQVYGKRAKTSEVKVLARKLHHLMDIHKVRKGVYPALEAINLGDHELHYYQWGMKKEICPDCEVTELSYKIVIHGNIDADPFIDAWTVESPDGKVTNVQDDVVN